MNVLQAWCFYLTTWFCNIRAVAVFVVSPFIYFIYLLYSVCLCVLTLMHYYLRMLYGALIELLQNVNPRVLLEYMVLILCSKLR